jgi:hypothetical protein
LRVSATRRVARLKTFSESRAFIPSTRTLDKIGVFDARNDPKSNEFAGCETISCMVLRFRILLIVMTQASGCQATKSTKRNVVPNDCGRVVLA